ncbi:regulator of G-protein signaling 22 [Ornithorhynchus anatinus]|uniref:Regulator of G protein signaling 22 n=1 Tax=Ornithorhynchus anatinus TaxID=9258 RepID=A0A6I8PCJ1_ORNAN|nr:regulator of G-protein signaling 22 [Ornithorhynchus anatinus]
MQEKRLTTDPPDITEEEFEDYLATDEMLVDYFNEFLCLPTFSEAIRFNIDFGVFEVVSNTPHLLKKRLKKILHSQKPQNPIYDVTKKAERDGPKMTIPSKDDSINIHYNILCLDREQGIRWIKKERLPAFLKSDCYFEYRLAKLVSQVEWSETGINFIIDPSYYPWIMKKTPPPPYSPCEDENQKIMKKFYVSLGEATFTQTKDWFSLAKQSQQVVTTYSLPCCPISSQIQRSFSYHLENPVLDNGNNGNDVSDDEFNPNQELPSEKKENGSLGIAKSGVMSSPQSRSVCVEDTPHSLPKVYLGGKQKSSLSKDRKAEVIFSSHEEFLSAYIHFIIRASISKLTGMPMEESSVDRDFRSLSVRVIQKPVRTEFPTCNTGQPLQSGDSSGFPSPDVDENTEALSLSSKSESIGVESRADWCIAHRKYDIGTRKEFERFKKFMKGSLGERYLWLWMDIERLKVLKDPGRHQRHIDKMRRCYLVSSGDCYLTPEILFKLDLLDGSLWNEAHLRSVQHEVVKPLLQYWGPRFCVTHSNTIKNASSGLRFWHMQQERPRKDVDPFPQMVTLLPLRPKSCTPRKTPSYSQKNESRSLELSSKLDKKSRRVKTATQRTSQSLPVTTGQIKNYGAVSKRSRFLSISSQVSNLSSFTDISECLKPQLDRKYTYTEEPTVKADIDSSALGGFEMESLLQSLYVENRAGFFFTRFCELSGNKLWKNSAYFWFDLQAYHQLFYQETLQPFKACKQAQFLYATYIAPSAALDIGLEKEKKKEIYMKINPPFEDLFDTAEEYILLLLLVPWTEMAKLDRCTYGEVELVEETRQLDSMYFRKLQALHQETVSKKDEGTAVAISDVPVICISKETELWSKVPEEFRNLNLNFLIQNKMELEYFRQFLDSHSAIMDLMCWTEIEQFRRMLHKDKEQRGAKSIAIKNKYLNKKYFFGPNSPATRAQQEQIMQLDGGWGKILHKQLSSSVLLEIQKYVRRRLESTWLPMFLANDQFAARQKIKLQMKEVAEDLIVQKHEKKLGIWKPVDSKWISSSKDIIAFRKALLNPVTAYQFQRYVALKGDFLEKGVLFWQEVQKYKDLCHSHCDDAIIQSKITTIINCFINSSIPPALQIAIPVEQAEKIIEHRRELGPYVFREAQMTIFGVLFKFWQSFCDFRSNLTDEKILSAIERKKEQKMDRLKGKLKDDKVGKEGLKSVSISGSIFTEETSYSGSFIARQVSWCYSKYIEALEQERTLLKIQEDLEKKSVSSGFSSFTTMKGQDTTHLTGSSSSSDLKIIRTPPSQRE